MPTRDGCRIADHVFLLALDDVSGGPRLSDAAMGLALASGLLAELVIAGAAAIEGGHVVLRPAVRPPDDAVAQLVHRHLTANPTVTRVRDWLRYLARDAYLHVGYRLAGSGQVEAVAAGRWARRWRGRTGVRYRPVDTRAAVRPGVRLRGVLSTGRPPPAADALLVGLLDAAGLGGLVLRDLPAAHAEAARAAVRLLPPWVGDLVGETAAAIGDAVLSHRL